jgi:hypothetical protein
MPDEEFERWRQRGKGAAARYTMNLDELGLTLCARWGVQHDERLNLDVLRVLEMDELARYLDGELSDGRFAAIYFAFQRILRTYRFPELDMNVLIDMDTILADVLYPDDEDEDKESIIAPPIDVNEKWLDWVIRVLKLDNRSDWGPLFLDIEPLLDSLDHSAGPPDDTEKEAARLLDIVIACKRLEVLGIQPTNYPNKPE